MTTRRHLTLWHTVQLSTAAPIVWCTNLIPRKRPDLPQLHSRQLQRVQRLLRRRQHVTPLRRGVAHRARGRFRAQRPRLRCLGSRRMWIRARFGPDFLGSGLPRRREKQRCHRTPVRYPGIHAANATRWGACPLLSKREASPCKVGFASQYARGSRPRAEHRSPINRFRDSSDASAHTARGSIPGPSPPISSAGRLHCPGCGPGAVGASHRAYP